MNIVFEDSFLYLNCNEEHAKQLGAVFVASKGLYRLPMTLGAIREAYMLYHDESLLEKGKQLREQFDALTNLKQQQDAEGYSGLRPYQRVDIQFLKQVNHKGIFNQQRTGKTPTILKLIESEEHDKIIVVCPASLRLNWDDEIERWTNYPSVVVSGTPAQRSRLYQLFHQSKKAILIISYETLRNDLDKHLLKKIDCLVLDEAHRIRNIKTKQTKAVNKLGKLAKSRIAATGTPSVNHASDIFGILHFLYPKKFSSYWQFVERYFTIKEGWFGKDIGKPKREKELKEMLELISTNRKRKDVMNWLPDVTFQTVKLEPDKQQLKEYTEMLKTFEIEQDGKILVEAANPLAQLTRLRQIILDPSLLGLKGKSSKEQFILDYIQDNPNEPIIIFSCFSSYLKKLQLQIESSELIIGEQSAQEKQQNVRDFQAGKFNVLLANIISGGVGFTIDRAETIIFLDRDFVPINNEQAQDRFIPTQSSNQAKKRTIIDLVVSKTVDERIVKLLKEKKNIIEVVNNYGLAAILDKSDL